MKNSKELEWCFYELTRGKQKEYIEYIQSAKKDVTKLNKVERIKPLILDKKGFMDKYKKC